jgi:energy-coupling factor transport system ATP-binding protein
MIEFDDVSFHIEAASGREIRALDHVSLRIDEGEYVALMGANGSGKSTLVRHMNALLLPTSGRVRVAGRDTADPACLWEVRQRVGVVFQNPDHQMVAPVVEEEVAFGPENLGVAPAEIRVRIDEALRAVRMESWRLHNPGNLSGGQKQRIAIASILAMRPRVMVLDEPTAMLDAEGRREVLAILRRLRHDHGISVVHVTHSAEEAAEADRVVVMERGRVAASGALQALAADDGRWRAFGVRAPAVREAIRPLLDRGLRLDRALPLDPDHAAPLVAAALRAWHPPDRTVAGKEVERSRAGRVSVEVKNLWHRYMAGTPFETLALRGVSTALRGGERLAIMGGTGSGKSTLIQHFNGLLRPTEGEVTVDGRVLFRPPTDLREVRRQVGLVFQFPEHQLFEETLARDVAYGPRNLGLAEEEVGERVRDALALVGLDVETFGDRSPLAMSGGEKRRAALAGVLAMRPSVLVLDEPTAGLDADGEGRVLDIIATLQEGGTATAVVTHDPDLMPRVADRLLLLDEGRVAVDGPLKEALPALAVLPAVSRLARGLRALGFDVEASDARPDTLAQEVIQAMMKQGDG